MPINAGCIYNVNGTVQVHKCTRDKWSKNSDDRPYRHLVTPRDGEWIRPTLTSIEYMLAWALTSQPRKQHLNWFNHYCIQCCKVSQCFSMGWTTPKIAPSTREICNPI